EMGYSDKRCRCFFSFLNRVRYAAASPALVACLIVLSFISGRAGGQLLTSPDGNIGFNLSVSGGMLEYNVTAGGSQVLENAPLGLILESAGGSAEHLGNDVLDFVGGNVVTVDASYPFWGQKATARNHYNERTFTITRAAGTAYPTSQLQVRAYDDGVAFRYIVPGTGTIGVLGESTSFGLPTDATVWYQPDLDDHEGNYSSNTAGNFVSNIGGPATVVLPNGGYLGITEGNVRNYSGMRLHADLGSRVLTSNLWDNTWGDFKFGVPAGAATPWRTVIIAGNLTELVNSTLVSNVADAPDPVQFADTSWIRPGKLVWHWIAEGGNGSSFTRQQAYINMAQSLGFDGTLIDSGWETRFEGFNGQAKYENLADLVEYGQARGVDVWVWKRVNRMPGETQYDPVTDPLTDPAKRGAFFDLLEQAGVTGVKIDFFNQAFFDPADPTNRSAEAQESIALYEAILADAAERHLMINFHGATKPTGMERTYPNEMTREGIRGLESNGANQRHNTILPFTRFLAGHADYTPVTFGTNKLTGTGTTFAHQLALGGLFTSAVTNFAFSPDQIAALDSADPLAVDYLRALPAVWDETLVLDGTVIGQRAVMARRTGDQWFLLGINGTTSPLVLNDIDLSFLGTGGYEATLVTDETQFSVSSQSIFFLNSSYDLDVSMLGGGGFAMVFTPAAHNGILGDLNLDGLLTVVDWTLFKAGQGTNFSGLSRAEAYFNGDLNGDFSHDLEDFLLFRTAYETNHGAGSFALLFRVPEPYSAALVIFGTMLCACRTRQRPSHVSLAEQQSWREASAG
ncbi:MAG: glycoside hydrolase family 97 catalytic domain-containing protein, partial [Pirellulales bacterium]